MVDGLSILLTHALIAFALWRLLSRDDLDRENAADPAAAAATAAGAATPKKKGWARRDA